MRLDEAAWAVSEGLGVQWRAVARRRVESTRRRLRAARTAARRAPADLRRSSAAAFDRFLRPSPNASRLLSHPALDYWLHLAETHFSRGGTPDEWRHHLGLLDAAAAEACRQSRGAGAFRAVLDPQGRVHLNGGPLSFDFGPAAAGRRVDLSVARGGVEATVAGHGRASAPESFLSEDGAASGAARCAPSAAPGMFVEDRSWLCNHAVVMHGRVELDDAERLRFARVIRESIAEAERVEPGFAAELRDLVRLLIPLKTPEIMASVSSSYMSMRGAICLSHSDSTALQVETLIHEFCHQKANFVAELDPLLEPGQGGQVYYSPWRKDARRLRGLLLGAHAFLNVARHLHRRMAASSLKSVENLDGMRGTALRVLQSGAALRALDLHADYTEFGSRFAARLKREIGALELAILRYPEDTRAEAAEIAAEHAKAWQLGDSGLHKPEGFADRLARAPFERKPAGGAA